MWLQVLGSAAGGGFPQWNCGCPCCRAVRDGSRPARRRTQSSVAVSADRHTWFLLNASPDVRTQIEAFPPLQPREGRATPLGAVLLTDAELDHTLGLLLLREAERIELHATPAIAATLRDGSGVLATLEHYCDVDLRLVVPGVEVPLADGLTYRAFDVPSTKRARFGGGRQAGRVVGYRLTDTRSNRAAVHMPGMQRLTTRLRAEIDGSACLLVDGTCWDDDEMVRLGLAAKTSQEMGHLAIDGPDGSLAQLAGIDVERTIYVHMNNTNPVLLEDSEQRRTLDDHGFEVAEDGLEVKV